MKVEDLPASTADFLVFKQEKLSSNFSTSSELVDLPSYSDARLLGFGLQFSCPFSDKSIWYQVVGGFLFDSERRLPGFGGGKSGYKLTEIGEIPKDWNVTELKEMTLSHRQGFYTKDRYVDIGVRLVRITDLMNPQIDYESMPMLRVSRRDCDLYKVKIGDFLFARSGAIGRYGIVYKDIEAIFGSYIIRFSFDSAKLKNEYFDFLYETNVISKQLLSITQGSSNININGLKYQIN